MQNHSVYPVAQAIRELPIALAQSIVVTKPGAARMVALRRLYGRLLPADQLRCRIELFNCLAAKRGGRLAQVA